MRTRRIFWIAALLATAACNREATDNAKARADRAVDRTEEHVERVVEGAKDRAEATKDRAEAPKDRAEATKDRADEMAVAARARIDRQAEATKAAAERGAEAVERKAEVTVDQAKATAEVLKNEADRREEALQDHGHPGGSGGIRLPTAGDPSEADADRDLTRRIRRDLVDDDSLSMAAHNVTIITRGGVVTLRGEVASAAERRVVLAKVKALAGAAAVVDRITVDTH